MARTLLVLIALLVGACAGPPSVPDAARAQYDLGWSLIMDAGRWTEAEAAFRAAHAEAPDWQLAATLVARISDDTDERRALVASVTERLESIPADERLLVDAFLLGLHIHLLRAAGETPEPALFERRMAVALANFRAWVALHPADPYVSAELVEWIHNAEGAEAALEAMETVVHPVAAAAPFFASFGAMLLSELGRFEEARLRAQEFAARLGDPGAPAVPYLEACLLFDLGRDDEALARVDVALERDPKHLMAAGLRGRILARIAENDP